MRAEGQNATPNQLPERRAVRRGSDRTFGFTIGGVLWAVAALAFSSQNQLAWLWLVLGTSLIGAAVVRPQLLSPLNAVWHRFGLLLGRVVNPIVMGVVFLVAVVPTAMILRAARKDPLRLRWDRAAETYWIVRAPPGSAGGTMRNQF